MHRWFHFRVTGAKETPLTLQLENAHTASFPEAWQGYQTVVSYDRLHWFRTETSYEAEGALVIKHTPKVVRARPSASPLLLTRGLAVPNASDLPSRSFFSNNAQLSISVGASAEDEVDDH